MISPMKWLKENWFKIAVLLVILFCACLVFAYEKKQQEIEKKAQINSLSAACQKLASQKKEDIAKDDPDLYLGNTYEYKYNPDSDGCILAYTGSYLGTSLKGNLMGHSLFEVDNLSTGESIFHGQVDPGDSYRETNEKFTELKDRYIGSTQ